MYNRSKLLELNDILVQSKNVGNAKFNYCIEKNIRVIKNEIHLISELKSDIDNIISSFIEKRNDIIRKYGSEDNDQILVKNDSENFEVFQKEISELIKENKESLELYDNELIKHNKFLNEDVDLNLIFHEISIDNIPDNFKHQDVFMDFKILN